MNGVQALRDPVDLSPHRRLYRARPLLRRSLALPADQCGGPGTDYLSALSTYLHHHTPEGAAA
ncbi:hypothetical protein [Streptomyces syringium]|uniref:hypothetical protein n=1 Tax=Streptomyces syringium TaxID=76729 RepID=UPI0033EE0A57